MSKRGMDIQGGSDRYGGSGGTETPADTPARATAAQMARRKIATMKGRTVRSTSPTKSAPSFGGFGQQQDTPSQPAQTGFSFGQTAGSGTNGFAFGQSQPSTNGGFAFGQGQPSNNSFTFGQTQPSQNGGFSFNAGNSSMSFPPTTNSTNPFSNSNGTSSGGGGFSGSIFNLPPAANSSHSQPTTNGFSFTSNASTTPSSPAAGSQENEAEKKAIQEREPYLDLAQQKQLEDIVGSHLPTSPAQYQKAPLDTLPPAILFQVAEFIRSLPSPDPNASRNAMSLFVKPYRGRSQKPWVTDSDRQFFQSTAQKLAPDQQEKLAQFVKDNVEPLKGKSNSELPGMDLLPNDVQYEMLQLAKSFAKPEPPAAKPTVSFAKTAEVETNGKDAPHIEETGDEPARPNPFASIKKPATPTFSTPAKTPSFSFTAQQTPKPETLPKSTPATPAFSFQTPTTDTPAKGTASQASSSDVQESTQETPAKSNPFAAISRPTSGSQTPGKTTQSEDSVFARKPTINGTAGTKSAGSNPFKFGQSSQGASAQTHTPARPSFSFNQTSKTPAAPSSNIFNLGSSGPEPPATAPVQKTIPPFSAPTAPTTSSTPDLSFQQQPTPQTATRQLSMPSYAVSGDKSRLFGLVRKASQFNESYRRFLADLPPHTDWSDVAKYYLVTMDEIKRQIGSEEEVLRQASKSASSSSQVTQSPAKRPSHPDADGQQADSPAKRTKTGPGFQVSSPQKPLSSTASLFNNILDGPDKPASSNATASSPESTPKPAASTPFKFQPSANGTGSPAPLAPYTSPFKINPAANQTADDQQSSRPAWQPPAGAQVQPQPTVIKAPSFSMPKFGGGGAANFMSAFGAQAQKQAEKEKAKRKAEDFDSDEDDEAEWERQDREKQEEKKRQLAQQARKVMKNVNGQFMLVDPEEAEEQTPPSMPSPTKIQQANRPQIGATAPSMFGSPAKPTSLANPFGGLSQPKPTEQKALPSVPQEAAEDSDPDHSEDAGAAVPVTPAKSGGGLFDRINKNGDGTFQRAEPETASKPTFSFSTASTAGDNTWKPETPIKFGGASETPGSTTPTGSPAKPQFSFTPKANESAQDASQGTPKFSFGQPSTTPKEPPKFSFGGATSNSTASTPKFSFGGASSGSTNADASKPNADRPFSSLFPSKPTTTSTPAGTSLFSSLGSAASTTDKPTMGFKFGAPANSLAPSNTNSIFDSASASRATTPGATTADEASTSANTDTEEAGDAAPAEEQRDLTALSAEELKTEDVLFESKARCRKYVKGGSEPWELKGTGILRVLKNKASGNARVLMRLDPGGQITINANILKDAGMYKKQGDKQVKMVFAEGQGEMATYMIQFGKPETTVECVESLHGVIE